MEELIEPCTRVRYWPPRGFVLYFDQSFHATGSIHQMLGQAAPGASDAEKPNQLGLAGLSDNLMLEDTMHYGLTGGWVQKFKGSYLLCFLHSALVFKARGQCDHHAFPLA